MLFRAASFAAPVIMIKCGTVVDLLCFCNSSFFLQVLPLYAGLRYPTTADTAANATDSSAMYLDYGLLGTSASLWYRYCRLDS